MPKNSQTDPRKHFAARLLPWLLGAAMLAVYLLTLNRWVTLANLYPVARVSRFLWQPELFNPLIGLVTLPFRWLPAAQIPLALNVFSAACAAVTLGLLARTVALLPHDRTEVERQRERSDFGFLTIGGAWFPPLLAVATFGLQFGCWQNATNFTGESLNLLVFASVIWLLAEHRLDEREGRLYLAAVIYGAGMPDNWALVGFLPVFVAAVLWAKGLEFFNFRFLSRMTLCGLAGMSLFLLPPLVEKFSGNSFALSFWEMLRPALRTDWLVIKSITNGETRHDLMLMALTSLLPVVAVSVRWSASYGDSSRIGTSLAGLMFHVIYAVILGVCLWIPFDPPFSPGQLAMGSGGLTFYYLSALALGYCSGYFLLVFGRKSSPSRRNPEPAAALPGRFGLLCPVICWGTVLLAALFAGALACKNLPLIRGVNDDTLLRYARLTEKCLPPGGGVLLSDGEGVTSSRQSRTLLMQAALARDGRGKNYVVVDTPSLNYAAYHRHLHEKFPKIWPQLPGTNTLGLVTQFGVLNALDQVAKSNSICYLNPSFGFYFELFYQEPHGLIYQLKRLPEDNLLPPPLSNNLIAENQDFWGGVCQTALPKIEQDLAVDDAAAHPNFLNWLLLRLHSQTDGNPNAYFAANLYSRSLNYWGVELQRAGHLPAAAQCFDYAQRINSDNVVATINLEFNQSLQAGAKTPIDPDRVNADQFGRYRSWDAVLNANGPFDEPSFLFVNSLLMAQNGLTRQTIAPFNRVRQLAPDHLPVRLWLAQVYLLNRKPDAALEALRDPQSRPARFGLTQTNSTELNVLAAAAHFQKNEIPQGGELLETELSRHPDDTNLLTTATQAYFIHGLYDKALNVIERRLAKTPDDPQWLFGRGYANLQASNYTAAVTAFTRALQIATNDPTTRFNRAYAYLQSGRLDEARADYAALQAVFTNAYQIAYGLGDVAWRQRQTNEAVRNYQIYLTNAPANAAEITLVRDRLKQLQKK
jgi:tetratricopeptide (TPR) repeat protein